MPRALRERPCEECGQPLSAACKDTRTHAGDCAYKFRTRRVLTANIAKRAGEDQTIWEPRTPEPLIRNPLLTPLVPPLTSGSGRMIPENGRTKVVRSRTHLIIPDCQVRPGVPLEHLDWIGRYIAAKRPDVIVCLGDFGDLRSLCSYDYGKKSAEEQRYVNDIAAVHEGMDRLTSPWRDLVGYKPRQVLTGGNHEYRIVTAVENDPRWEGKIRLEDLGYEAFGWEVHPFLEVVEIDGIEYSHYFTSGVMGRPVSSAAALLRVRQGSAIMGHIQATDVSFHPKTQAIAIFAGTCYLHDEEYLGLQGNSQRRQILMLHEVDSGHFDPMFVSLDFLRRRYARAA
jgi:hypothetical protein